MSGGSTVDVALADEASTLAAGARFARALAAIPEAERSPRVVTLSGPLGSGKTTFVRGLLRALGIGGAIRSPSYTLVEEYSAAGWELLHLDLYRLAGAADLAQLGLRDRLQGPTAVLVEWPEQAAGGLPPADVAVELSVDGAAHRLRGQARTSQGQPLVAALAE